MNGLTIVKVERDPKEKYEEGVPKEVADVQESLPPPHRFPNFIVTYEYKGVAGTLGMALELDGRDMDWDGNPVGMDPDDMADFSEDATNAIYGSKPYADAVEALEKAPPSFWQ